MLFLDKKIMMRHLNEKFESEIYIDNIKKIIGKVCLAYTHKYTNTHTSWKFHIFCLF